MVKEFNSLEEIQKYYDISTNTYIFKEDDEYIDFIKFNFDLNITSNINAWDINSLSIVADNIIYFAVCFAHFYIRCISIKGRISNAKHFVLDGKIKIVK